MRLMSTFALAALLSATSVHAAPSFYWANPRPTGTELGGVDFESAAIGYAVGAYGASLRTTDGGVTWEDRTDLSSNAPSLDDVLAVSPGVLLAAGDAPGLHRSTDGGVTWNPVANPAATHLRNLFALDASTLFAVGDAGRIVRSTNGGGTWTLLGAPANTQLVDQWWLDGSNAYVIGQNCVRRTTNGGMSWSTIPDVSELNTFFPGDIQFLDAQDGWIFTDFDTYRTTNGGGTWATVPMPFAAVIYQEEAIVLDAQTWIVATEAEGASINKTTDGGAHWSATYVEDGVRGVTDLERLPGGEIIATTTGGDLLRSTDVGATWTNFTTVAGPTSRENLNTLDLDGSGLGFAGGWGNLWIQTTDGGRTWFDPATNPGLSIVDAITMRDASFMLAGGTGTVGHSDVRRSTDGGATWTTHALSASYVGYPQGLAALPDGTCFCATYGGTTVNFVYRSTDGGDTWHLRNNGVPANVRLNDLFFLDSQHGFVCGGDTGNPSIYRTADGGGLWTPVGETGLVGDDIRDMHWFSLSDGLVVNMSRVQRTTNGGGSWTTVLAGSSGMAIDFLDALHGAVCSYDNTAATTTDGGATWTPLIMPLPGFLSDVATTATGFLAVGTANSILGMDADEGPVAVEPSAPAVGSSLALAVWPNPLRIGGDATLSFRVDGEMTPVESRLYDVAGRLVARTRAATSAKTGALDLKSTHLGPGVFVLDVRGSRGERLDRKVTVIR